MIVTKQGAIALLGTLLCSQIPQLAWAETLLQKIEKTGEFNAAVPRDAIPFGFIGNDGKPQGYSLDLIRLVHKTLETKLQKPIKLNLQEATVDNRLKIIATGKADLMCGSTTITQERLQTVDFSAPFFITGAQFLVKQAEVSQVDIGGTLAQVPVAFIPNTTTDQILRQIYPQADWVAVKNRSEGLKLLNQGRVKAVASDGILLIGEVVGQGFDPKDYAIGPQQPITTELYGCILPKNDPEWKEWVDTVIVSRENLILQNKWFNLEKGIFPYLNSK
jgi:polar amino acid transport system substrate-binding protein